MRGRYKGRTLHETVMYGGLVSFTFELLKKNLSWFLFRLSAIVPVFARTDESLEPLSLSLSLRLLTRLVCPDSTRANATHCLVPNGFLLTATLNSQHSQTKSELIRRIFEKVIWYFDLLSQLSWFQFTKNQSKIIFLQLSSSVASALLHYLGSHFTRRDIIHLYN